jgi:hypothetical protein
MARGSMFHALLSGPERFGLNQAIAVFSLIVQAPAPQPKLGSLFESHALYNKFARFEITDAAV